MMAAPNRRPAAEQQAAQKPTAPPPYYIAVEPLFIDGNQFARAHNPGDMVPADHVDRFGWHANVRPPDGYETADQPADGKDAGNPSEPETPEGQATTTGKGEA
ncbi:hypothetical protein [Nonomuraea sp. NPDC049646]|uniref:hypothetical protein n=1 Tax=unclassified Nonomuraea TaxID=2593643 RepID=UPI00378CE136